MPSAPARTEPWLLSAVATTVLWVPDSTPSDLLKLGLKELIARGVWRLEREAGRDFLNRPGAVFWLARGGSPVPPLVPLPALDAALARAVGDRPDELVGVVRRVHDHDPQLVQRLRDHVTAHLESVGLLRAEHRRVLGLVPRMRWQRTADGQAWARDALEREDRLKALRARGDDVAFAAEAAALGALVLLLPADLRRAVSEAVDGPRGHYDGSGPVVNGDFDLDAFGGMDASFDGAVGGGGGGGGDGGGGDGSD